MPRPASAAPAADLRALAFDATTTGVVVADACRPDHPIVEANPAFERLTGYARGEVLGRNCRFLQGPGTDPEAVARIGAGLAAGREVSETVLNYRRDGTPFWNELRITPVRDEAGALIHFVGIQSDVTGRVEAEATLAAERDLFQAVLDQLPDEVYVKDAESRFVRLNRATAATLGVAGPAAAIGKTDDDFFPEGLAGEYRADEGRILETGTPMLGELDRQGGGQGARRVLASRVPLRDAAGHVVGLVGVNRDVTERVRAEAALRASEERLRLALQAAGMAIWDWDAETDRVVRFAGMPALYGLVEAPSEEPSRYLSLVHPEDRGLVAEADRRLFEGGEAYAAEYRVVWPDGTVRWLREVGEATHDTASRPIRVLGVTQDVTDRRQAEEAARAAADRFRTLVEELPALVYVEALDAVVAAGARPFSYTNPRVAQLLGFSAEDWEDDPGLWRSRLHPEDAARVLTQDERTEATGEPFRCEYRLLARDGRTVWLRDDAVLVRGPGGEPRFWVGVQLDITSEKASEAALRASEERFRALAEHLPALVTLSEPTAEARTLYANPFAERLLGYPPAEYVALGPSWPETVHPDDRPAVLAEVARVAAAGGPFRMEYRRLTKDGDLVWVRDDSVLVRDADGAPRYWQTVQVDVTEQRRLREELAEREARLRTIFEAVDAGVVLQNACGAIVAANAAAARLLGLPPDQLLGRTSRDPRWAAVRADGTPLPGLEHPAMVALRTGRPQEGTVMGVLRPDAALVWLAVNARPLARPGEPTPHAVVSAFVDVTDRKQAEDALRAAKEAAEEASRLKGAFLSTMSHELRTPLNAILGYADLLRVALEAKELVEEAADAAQVARSGEHLLGLVNDVLDLSRIEAGGLDLEPTALDLAVLAGEVGAELWPLAAAKGVGLVVDVPAGIVALVDQVRFRQVLLNLVGNAVKFTDRGRVVVSARTVAGRVEISVSDTGIGIPAEALPHVFDEFRQADESTTRRYGGTGLGLAIARRLVEAHRGSIEAASEPGVGSTFTVTLPLARRRDGGWPDGTVGTNGQGCAEGAGERDGRG